ncbi:MAG: hypothetical protein V3U11_07985 [Planctomycetota bacterium]
MRYMTSSGFHISSLPSGLKLVLSLYLIANLFGLVVANAKFMQRMEPTPSSVQEYYQGDAEGADPQVIPGDGEGKSVRYLTDTTHPHLFTVPLVLLVICHLAHLTQLSQLLLGLLDLGAFLGFFLMFGSPWVLSVQPTTFALLMIVGGSLLTVCMGLLCVIPLFAMWSPRSVPDTSG